MLTYKFLAVHIILWIINSATGKKTGLQFNVNKYNYRGGIEVPCGNSNKFLCRTVIRSDYNIANGFSNTIIVESPRYETMSSFTPPIFKEFIVNGGNANINIIYLSYPKNNNGFILNEERFLDTMLFTFTDNYFEINCNPCVSATAFTLLIHTRIKLFPISINEKVRHLRVNSIYLRVVNTCKQGISRLCEGVITNGACPTIYNKRLLFSIQNGDSAPNIALNAIANIPNNEEMILIILAFDNMGPLLKESNKVGFGVVAAYTSYECLDDIIYAHNFNKNPYELYVNLNAKGENDQLNGFAVFYVASYQYGGINARYQCEIKRNYQKCINSSQVSCADKLRVGENCETDISMCKINPCKNGGKCHGIGSNYYCECKTGSRGTNCEKFTCNNECSKSVCISPNKCGQCAPGYSGNDCNQVSCENYKKCKNGVCEIKNGSRICSCSRSQFYGSLCQHECSSSCVNGLCYFTSGISLCICIQGYYGEKCDRIVAINPIIIPKSLYFKRNAIIYAAVGSALIAIIFLFQIFYITLSKKDKNVKIHLETDSKAIIANSNLKNAKQKSLDENSIINSCSNDDDNNYDYINTLPTDLSDSSSEEEEEEVYYGKYYVHLSKDGPKNIDNQKNSSESSAIEKSVSKQL